MTLPAANLALAVVWMAATGHWSAGGFGLGLLVGALLLSLFPPKRGSLRYGIRIFRVLKLLLVFLREFSLSVFRVIKLVLSPRLSINPGLFHFPLTLTRDFEITLLANLITLTPGTLTVDVSADRKILTVHAIDCSDPDAARRDIAEGFERLIREAFA
ncbi:Na+/H+ antiporter subunit E [Rhizobium sp. KVB221]|uniref:Na+/H+ antiporter subunit E n=1 Tax=Rhizobium setariae TaxID=2801340 RepID=A0A936YIY4_9HYPH|nr:Na+/H+ antiporter subunit E [Rhizobium setariae]MBL0370993.1 Na+/H+ antiporter subunit E [Rhizobium setariae]